MPVSPPHPVPEPAPESVPGPAPEVTSEPPPDSGHNTSLWRHADFRRLWAGDTVSQFAGFVGNTALSLLAATVLAAGPFQMGLLTASENAAFLLLGLPAGVWVDRMRRRPLMIRADLTRAVVLLSVPVSWWAGWLTLAQLVVVALLVSVGTLFFDVAHQSSLPSLVGRKHLVEGNAKLQTSHSAAQILSPGTAGALTQLAGRPMRCSPRVSATLRPPSS